MKDVMIKKAIAEHEKGLEKLYATIDGELTPFIDGIYKIGATSREFKIFEESYLYFVETHARKSDLFFSLIKDVKDPESIKDKILTLFQYLGIVETIGNAIVDI